jgi:oligopeptide/dipeptide ABC transporter ATP-binding protein
MHLLTVDGLVIEESSQDHEHAIVRDISFGIGRGEFVGLVGESGSGKSLTARALIRLLAPNLRQAGSVAFDHLRVDRMTRPELRRFRASRVAMIFQDPRAHVDPLWRVEQHLGEGMRLTGGLSRAQCRARSLDLLSAVGIRDPEHCLRLYPHELSGGMLQRVMIAGALAGAPDLIIADEPTTALDVTTQAEIMAILADLRRERQLAMLFITHDLDLAAALCDRVLVMYAGTIVEEGLCRDVFEAPLHPYSWGLLNARPLLEAARRLAVIPGQPMSGADAPPYCSFADRCAWVRDECKAAVPPLRHLAQTRRSACLRIETIADELR